MNTEESGREGGSLKRRTALLLVTLVVCLPTLWLLHNFLNDFVHGMPATYPGSFWMALCGMAASILIATTFTKTKPKTDTTVLVTTDEYEQMAKNLKTTAKDTAVSNVIDTAWVMLIVCTLSMFGLPKIVFWVGLAAMIVFDVTGTIMRMNRGKNRTTPGVLLLTLVIGVYSDLFWMAFAYAYGWLTFLIWAILRIVAWQTLMAVMAYGAKIGAERAREQLR